MGDLDRLNTVAVKHYGSSGENADPELALILSACDAPTYGLESADGVRYHWRQDLTRPATPDETIKYWRQRAETAERLLQKSVESTSRSIANTNMLIERLEKYGAACNEGSGSDG